MLHSQSSPSHYETLFHAASVDLVVPEASRLPAQPEHDAGPSRHAEWWAQVNTLEARHVAFFDEKLFYLVAVHLPTSILADFPWTPSPEDDAPSAELLRFLSRLQPTLTVSFLPPLPPLEHRKPPPLSIPPNTSSSLDPHATPTPHHQQPSSSSLAPPSTGHPLPPTPRSSDMPHEQGGEGGGSSSGPPVTPNPFPGMQAGEERYAHVEGITVWEGNVEESGHMRRSITKSEDGWDVTWRGEVPIAYVRTPIQNPLLALTASVTLRDQPARSHKRAGLSVDAASIRSGTDTIRTDGTEEEAYEDDEDNDEAGMEEIDLLGGLGGEETMPTARLAPSLRQDLSLPSRSPATPVPPSALTPATAPSYLTPSTASTSQPSRERSHLPTHLHPVAPTTTLRKSYRRILSLSAGLRVRMRTLFLPQLLPLSTAADEGETESEGESEKRVVLCVELENAYDPHLSVGFGFQVENIVVEIAGKGGKASAELVCQPEHARATEKGVFPVRLDCTEQYNLLYVVSIASAPEERQGVGGMDEAVARSLGRGDEQRPVSITVIGRPYPSISSSSPETETVYPTKAFESRWNCTLDLAPFYASLSANFPPLTSATPPSNNVNRKRISKPNAIAGDKRYSLATLASEHQPPPAPHPGAGPRPLLPSQRVASFTQRPPQSSPDAGLLVSVKLLQGETPRQLQAFSIEVFVHNRTDGVRRFRLNIPSMGQSGEVEAAAGRLRELWERRKARLGLEGRAGGLDDAILKQSMQQHMAAAPALLPLENDIRCGPLLPGASLSARIRLLAVREGTLRLDRLRVLGVGEDWEYTMRPVLDVVVAAR